MTLPKGPRTLALRQLMQWIKQPLEFMETNVAEYGDPFIAKFGIWEIDTLVFISDPMTIQELYSTDARKFNIGKANDMLKPVLGDYSVLLLDGEPHERQRRLMMPQFHGERMRAYGQMMLSITDEVLATLKPQTPFDVRNVMQEITLRVILSTVFGLERGERYQQIQQLLATLLDGLGTGYGSIQLYVPLLQIDLGPRSPWGKFKRLKQQVDALLLAEIRERRQQAAGDRTDILSLLMGARDEAGEGMGDQELRDELITLLVAGHETTATALSWALYWVHHTPGIYEKLMAELEPQRDNPAAWSSLPYLSAVCQETLRLYPVALIGFGRVLEEAFTLGGYTYAPDTALIPCIYLTHHRPDLFPEPKQFRPERFQERQFTPYEYMPFGGANRRCLGMAFALYELKLVLARILLKVELAILDGDAVRPVRRSVTLSPSNNFQMVVRSSKRVPAFTESPR